MSASTTSSMDSLLRATRIFCGVCRSRAEIRQGAAGDGQHVQASGFDDADNLPMPLLGSAGEKNRARFRGADSAGVIKDELLEFRWKLPLGGKTQNSIGRGGRGRWNLPGACGDPFGREAQNRFTGRESSFFENFSQGCR